MKDVIIPTGRIMGERIVRANKSEARSNPAPAIAEKGINKV